MRNGVIFDMDGLMFDTERLWDEVWEEVGHTYGVDTGKEFSIRTRGTNQADTREVFLQLFGADGVNYEELQGRCLARLEEELERHIPVKPGLYELLDTLKGRDIPMAVASSTHQKMVLHNLELAGITSYFSSVVTGDMVEHGKLAPDIFLAAAKAIGRKPAHCLVLEDSANGIRAAAAAGCLSVMVPDLDPPTPELARLYTARADSLKQVAGLLDTL